ncbi:hypothetical protein ARMGADRAFT_1033766 [Armillaria gallica]|uniref:Uncharacterized protein n=1 Tax=Armillaria gallica TaxID=47427 RepID=A0A2H3DBJ3_ARMGA|nr:hypothetical protein ARMGADRAFT_1033766 [Armillaria gallica]
MPLLGAYSELQLGARSWSLSCVTSVSYAIHTLSADILEGWKAKWSADVEKYRKAQQVLLSLRGVGDWTDHLWELKDTDMASMYGSVLDVSKVASQASLVQCKKKQKVTANTTKDMPKDISWIWLSEGSLTTYDKTTSLEGIGQDILEGVCAYVVQQADAHHQLTMHFAHMWDMVYVLPDKDDYKSDDDDVHP